VQVICGAINNQDFPRIDGRYVVWHDGRTPANERDIYCYDLCLQFESPVYQGPGVQAYPEISGNMVVWVDSNTPSGTLGVYGADLNNLIGGRLLFADEPDSDQTHPAICADKLVWADNRDGPWEIYGADLDVPAIFEIYMSGENPAVCENFVAWDYLTVHSISDIDGMALGELPWKRSTLLDFEYYYPKDTEITNQYPGVTFYTPGPWNDKPFLIDFFDSPSTKGGFASGWKALRCFYDPDHGGKKLGMEFSELQSEISFALGNGPDTYTIFVFDSMGVQVFTQIEEVHGDDVYKEVAVQSTSANIKRIEIYSDTELFFAIDDLRFDPSGGCNCMDFNQDRIVNLIDFARFANCWLKTIPK